MKSVDDEFSRRHILQGIAACCTVLAADSLADEASRRSSFSAVSTAEEVTAGLDLTGKTALVTGCNSGIGYETMRVLALRGAHVIGTARTAEKGRSACATVQGRATPVALELTDFDSVARCAREVRALGTPIDMLILNAGIILERLEQVNGLEKQFVVNHLGHFLLTVLLIDAVKAARQGRVVVVGSGNHRDAPKGGIQFDDLSGRGWSDRAYSHSKLANGLFSLELASRLRGTNATSNCVSPGHTRTNIMRNMSGDYRDNAKTAAQGAATTCYVATQPSLVTVSGKYFADCVLTQPSAVQTDAAMAARLWNVSEALTARWLESG